MNIEMLEVTAVTEAAAIEESSDLLALSLDDLDLVGGGTSFGSLI
jgi:hypothetical protein